MKFNEEMGLTAKVFQTEMNNKLKPRNPSNLEPRTLQPSGLPAPWNSLGGVIELSGVVLFPRHELE